MHPAGAAGLPTTVSFLGSMNSDADLIRLGYAFEQATKYRKAPSRFPDLVRHKAGTPKVTGPTRFQIGVPTKPKKGSTKELGLYGTNVKNAYSYELKLKFKPRQLRPLVKKITSGTSGFTRATVKGSTLTIVHTKLGTSPAAVGDLALARIPVKVRGKKINGLRLTSVTMIKENGAKQTMRSPRLKLRQVS